MSSNDDRISEDESSMEEKEKIRIKKIKSESSDVEDNSPPVDSSDEDEDENLDEFEDDGFVVDEEEEKNVPEVDLDDDDAPKSSSRLKRLRKGGKRKRFQLDQEDLDLVAENQGFEPLNKLKRGNVQTDEIAFAKSKAAAREPVHGESTANQMDEFEEEPEYDSDDDDFLAAEDDEEGTEPRERKKKKKDSRFTSINIEQFEDARDIYDDSWLHEKFGSEFDDYSFFDTSLPEKQNESDYKKNFEPQALEDMYLTPEDEAIKMKDIPERFQNMYPSRETPSEDELLDEAAWIADILKPYALPDERITEKVRDILTFLLCSHYEIPFIATYRKEFWMPSLTIQDLWKIAELDHQWFSFQSRKKTLLATVSQTASSNNAMETNDHVNDTRLSDIKLRIETATNEETLMDLGDYYHLHYSNANIALTNKRNNGGLGKAMSLLDSILGENSAENNSTENATKSTFKKPLKHDAYTLAKSNGLENFFKNFGLVPSELAKRCLAGMDPTSMLLDVTPCEIAPLEAAREFISPPLYATTKQVLEGARNMFVQELSAHPAFRSRCAEFFDVHAAVSTRATTNGRLYIDLLHPYANIRHLVDKPISSFKNSSTFLLICKAVEEGLIQLSIDVPKEKFEMFVSLLGKSFDLSSLQDDPESPSYLWAEQRKLILIEALKIHVFPKLINRCRQRLRKEATIVVLAEYEAQLEKMIRAGGIPFPEKRTISAKPTKRRNKYDSDDEDDEMMVQEDPCIMSICLSDPSQGRETIAMLVIIDKDGEIRDTLSILASLRVEDKISMRHFLKKHLPFAIVVGIDSYYARKFYEDIKRLVDLFVEEERSPDMRVSPMPLDVAYVFQNSRRAEKEFSSSAIAVASPEAALLLRRGVSLARRLLDPMLELAGLVNKDDNIMGLNFHPLRKMVNPVLLRQRIDQCFVKVVNEVGVDINRIAEHTWMQPVLQFVSGLGIRKATALLEGLSRIGHVTCRNQLKDSYPHTELRAGEYWGPVVWDNAIAFIKIANVALAPRRRSEEDEINPLDGTRTHPIAYLIAKRIGDDLTTMGHIKSSENYVAAIAKKNELISHIDLEALIEKLRSKSVDKELTVKAIVQELQNPFADPRKYQELTLASTFDHVFGENALQIGMTLSVRVVYENRKTYSYDVVLENRMPGRVPTSGSDAPTEPWVKGQSVQAKLVAIDKESFECQLSAQHLESKWNALLVPLRDPWLAEEPEETKENSSQKAKPAILTRNIVHARYTNKPQKEVETELSSKKVGSYFIHPSTNKSYLTITAKFFFDTYAHISIQEQEDKTLKIDKEVYENIDDLVVRFMEPTLIYLQELTQHSCWKELNTADMKAEILREKQNNPKRAPYHIAPSVEHPNFNFVLYYIPGTATIRKEFVRITPEGFKYRSRVFNSVDRLISYFKKHFNDPAFLQQQQQQQQQQRPGYSARPPMPPMGGPMGYPGVPQSYPPPQYGGQWNAPPPAGYPPSGMGWNVPNNY